MLDWLSGGTRLLSSNLLFHDDSSRLTETSLLFSQPGGEPAGRRRRLLSRRRAQEQPQLESPQVRGRPRCERRGEGPRLATSQQAVWWNWLVLLGGWEAVVPKTQAGNARPGELSKPGDRCEREGAGEGKITSDGGSPSLVSPRRPGLHPLVPGCGVLPVRPMLM